MFFIASKIFWVLARPLNLIMLLLLAGLLVGRLGRRRLARGAIAGALLLFAVIGYTQAVDYALLKLETAIPQGALPDDPAGIIVLGGGLDSISAGGGTGYNLREASDRIVKGLALHRQFPRTQLHFSGGNGNLLADQPPETVAALALVNDLYGDDRGIRLESRSRTTWENGVEMARIAGEEMSRPWLLVTSATHMPRAAGVFRKLGFNIVPVPTDWRADPLAFPWLTDQSPQQFVKASVLVRELIGLVAYRMTGRIEGAR